MSRLKKFAPALIAALSLAACSQSSVQSGLEPKISTCSPTNSTLEWFVGTANVAGAIGLNTLVSLRQNAGGSCTAGASLLDDAPTITGPTGFVVPAVADAGGDGGTASISGTILANLVNPPPTTTFDDPALGVGSGYGLATGYGFMPSVDTNSLSAPNFAPYPLPFYVASTAKLSYLGGPPAFVPPKDSVTHTSTRDGTFPPGYLGYVLGFVDFAATPVVGTYSLAVVIPTGLNTQTGVSSYATDTKTASIASVAGLATWAAGPTFVSDGTGGGTITTNFAGGAGLKEEYIEAVDLGPGGVPGTPAATPSACIPATSVGLSVSYPIYYTFTVAPGTATVTVPDDIGPSSPGTAQGHTFCTNADNGGTGGDTVQFYGFATDYGLYASAYPQSNGNPAPTVTTGANGQADVTLSPGTSTGTE